jgi:hypothetical protein
MQFHYVHGVMQDKDSFSDNTMATADQQQRIAIVFRRGRYQEQTEDNGVAMASPAPRVPMPYMFGTEGTRDLDEGRTYTRAQLYDRNAHR